ncbi:MAG TPA: 4-phosphoerythronate dehydrogenase PdxB [Prolixibacteraceae bacterium]|nr:4-phosphoerythronate dehydrogenase PdxB [Prolixibacteraceae bacterium]
MKIIIDNKIPYIKGALEPFAEVIYLSGKDTTPEIVKNADAIITRTRTICNENLLAGSTVKMIATATIGYDHIDTNYCEINGIEWTNAPGCNSWSVAQYLMATLFSLAQERGFCLSDKTIGVIGAGNVGSKIAKLCAILGMKVLVNDPPRARAEGSTNFVTLEQIQSEADIVTFHTPLTRSGDDKTFHMANKAFFDGCKKKPIFINSSRGEVMDTEAVKHTLAKNLISDAVIDCWENEPDIDLDLLKQAFISTPHIAGYSKDGKANGTSMSVQAISKKFNLGIDNWTCSDVELPIKTTIEIDGRRKNEQSILAEAILFTYPIHTDSKNLKLAPKNFEQLRGDYPVRREFPVFTIKTKNIGSKTIEKLKAFGFQTT